MGECARVIKVRIEQGDWAGDLPGERRLADTLQVGRDTVRLALQQLEREGVISPAAPGARRKVSVTSSARIVPPQDAMRVGMLSPWNLELLPQPTLLEVDRIRMALAPFGGSLTVIAPPWYRAANPGKRLKELLRQEACNAWILLRSSAEIQKCMEQEGVPCLIRGYPHEGVELPHLDVDWAATARHAAGVLWRLGHRRVAVLTPQDALKGVTAAVQGLGSLGEPGFEVIQLRENGTVVGVTRVLSRVFRGLNPPTAVIATRPRQAVTALSWLQASGLKVPQEVSLLSFAHEPVLDHLWPEVGCYVVSPEMIARRLVRRIETLCQGHGGAGGNPWIMPKFRKGDSIGPVNPV